MERRVMLLKGTMSGYMHTNNLTTYALNYILFDEQDSHETLHIC